MGFTMWHNKDGKMVPIKMSIWDAFHGVPDPKPRKPKACTCCGKFHAKKETINTSHDGNGKQIGWKKDGDDGKSHSSSTSPPVAFTSIDDMVIKQMKSDNKSWNEIVEALGKSSKSQLQARYKELQNDSGATSSGKEDADKKQVENKAVGEKKKAENLAKIAGEGKGGKSKKGQGKAEEPKDNKTGKKGSGDMKAWASSFEKRKWLAVASKHYDKTGQRISPEMARKMAEED